jgi:hypothetical protein
MLSKFLYLLQQDPFLPSNPSAGTGTVVSTATNTQINNNLRPNFGSTTMNNPLLNPMTFDFTDLLHKLIAYAFLAVFALSVIFIFWGGISFILSGGQEEKVKNAVNTIRYAIIGLLVAIFSFAIVAWIGRQFNLDLIQYIRPDNIMETINALFSGQ